jgi:WD40-like Beta Propeller Repeat
VLTGPEMNAAGDSAEPGQKNIYRWNGGHLTFIVTAPVFTSIYGFKYDSATYTHAFNQVETRTTPDGSVFVFASNGSPTSYPSGGFTEIYRYEAASGELACVSCNPSGAPAVSNAKLTAEGAADAGNGAPDGPYAVTNNLSADGSTVFFETGDQLVPGDVTSAQDVYEWENQGDGSCGAREGCLSLISSGHSLEKSWIYGVSPDGTNVYFTSTDALTQQAEQGATSLYDARVGGGFPTPPPTSPCAGEACQGAGSLSPSLAAIGSNASTGPGNVKAPSPNNKKHKKKHKPKKHKKKHQSKKKASNKGKKQGRSGKPAAHKSGRNK